MSNLIRNSLEQTREELLQEITSLTFEELNRKPNMETWSVAQNCHHLYLTEIATVRAIKWGLKEGKESDDRRKNIQLILDRTVKYPAPSVVEPSEESLELEQLKEMLADSRKQLLETVNSLEDLSELTRKVVKHPAFDTMALDQWVELLPLHEQRHLSQIRETLKE
ncbi:DinB family protein [Ornithinibacillus bavariensis]|uniref:PadR family transcriptional regulator n=1 Tax=Ornithinibacillus bavariensis TaxID=545502 RepID=A0A919X4D8_9BACI|nr:DinB family protein [Ornithinibacillus bavariensis]GIO25459.1 PadR family transcriptional regulator [Ornithinibacillus bavariensis]